MYDCQKYLHSLNETTKLSVTIINKWKLKLKELR